MKIVITGIAGFLGSHLAEQLSILGHEIDGNDAMLCPSVSLGKYKNLDCCNLARDYQATWDPLEGTEVLIHCAATAHEGLSNFSPSFITKNIFEASVATFSAAIAAGVKRIIFMSSMARYGNGQNLYDLDYKSGSPFKEDMVPFPIDPYGIAKVAAEQTLISLCKLHDVEYVILVPHNIIGPRQRYCDPYRNVASIMINRALQDKPLLIYGDGQQKRCFSPVGDCLDSIIKCIDAPISGEIINIGPDKGEITILELAEIIRDLTGGRSEIQFIKPRPNEVKEAYCSSDKARKLLGYEQKQSLRSCLAEMVLYIKEHGTKQFVYDFPIEIPKGCPPTWTNKLI